MEQLLAVFLAISLLCHGLQAAIHARERKDLYSRIMARDLTDYEANQGKGMPKTRNLVKAGLKRGVERLYKGGE